jgi:hypothetical protein
MKIIQHKDGSGEIVFSWKEIWILIKKRKLRLTAESLKHLSNNLVKLAVEFNENFSKAQQQQKTYSNEVDVKDDRDK